MLKLIALVLPLGLDTFAVSAALGLGGITGRDRIRVGVIFTLFEAGMPLVGLLGGNLVTAILGELASALAIAVLLALGAYLILSDGSDEPERCAILARTRGMAVLGLGLSISLDELAIGFTLGLVRVPIVWAVVLIGAQAFLVAQLGFRLGTRVGDSVREGAERAAGVVLVLLGIGLGAARLFGVAI